MKKMKITLRMALTILLGSANGIHHRQALKFAAVALLLVGSLTSCEQKAENNSVSPLTGTKWKLETLIDENGTARKPEPENNIYDSYVCYTIIFDSDTTFTGTTSNNEVSGIFDADFGQSTFSVKAFGGTKRGEMGDGVYYCDKMHTIQSFSLTENELILYFDHKNDYLKFKPLEQ